MKNSTMKLTENVVSERYLDLLLNKDISLSTLNIIMEQIEKSIEHGTFLSSLFNNLSRVSSKIQKEFLNYNDLIMGILEKHDSIEGRKEAWESLKADFKKSAKNRFNGESGFYETYVLSIFDDELLVKNLCFKNVSVVYKLTSALPLSIDEFSKLFIDLDKLFTVH